MADRIIDIDLRGLENAQRRLDRLLNFDRGDLLQTLGQAIRDSTVERLQEGKTAPDGSLWPEVSPRYAERKREGRAAARNLGGSREARDLLVLTGELRDSMTSDVVSDREVVIGPNSIPVPYAAAHQFGYAKRNLPARPYLGLSDRDVEEIESLTVNFFKVTLNDSA